MTSTSDFPIDWVRNQFPALTRRENGQPAAYFDGPGGSQTPGRVIESVSNYMAHTNANRGGRYATARESDCLLDRAHEVVADFLGTTDPSTIVFGANMTTMTFALSRALGRTWRAGDEIVVTRLDHDGNVTPWVLAARDSGATIRYVPLRTADCTLDPVEIAAAITPRTRLIALGCASNIVGTINPVREVCRLGHAVGAQVFLDAVHYAPHALPDVHEWGCDWLACSAYKFFGPHVSVLYGRKELLTSLTPYKLRPVTEELPGRWMTGTQNFEGIAGTMAAVEYLAELGRYTGSAGGSMRNDLRAAYDAIGEYERSLAAALLDGLMSIPKIKVLGLTDRNRLAERTPTFSFVHPRFTAEQIADRLGERGLFVGHGNFYALQVTESLDLEPAGVVRIGLMHYNTLAEIQRLIAALHDLG